MVCDGNDERWHQARRDAHTLVGSRGPDARIEITGSVRAHFVQRRTVGHRCSSGTQVGKSVREGDHRSQRHGGREGRRDGRMEAGIIPEDKSASTTTGLSHHFVRLALADSDRADAEHVALMRLALSEAKKCVPSPTAFCVGCVISSPSTKPARVVSTGYSRELPGNTHAEQCALDKLSPSDPLAGLDLYTTMEPCSVRLSGNLPCVDRILALPKGTIKRVFMGVAEPDDFVECKGTRTLKEAGLEVITVEGFMEEALEVARRGHD